MTIIYEIPGLDGFPNHYLALKDKACAFARVIADITGRDTTVIMHETANVPERELVIALLEGKDWSGKQETVFTAQPRTVRSPEMELEGEPANENPMEPLHVDQSTTADCGK